MSLQLLGLGSFLQTSGMNPWKLYGNISVNVTISLTETIEDSKMAIG